MRMFRGPNQPAETVIQETPAPISDPEPELLVPSQCTPEVCLGADPEAGELTPEQEAAYDAFEAASEDWGDQLEKAKFNADILNSVLTQANIGWKREIVSNTTLIGESKALKKGRIDTPNMAFHAGDFVPLSQPEYIRRIRSDAAGRVRQLAEAAVKKPVNEVLLTGSMEELTALRDHLRRQQTENELEILAGKGDNGAMLKVGPPENLHYLVHPYTSIFNAELRARTELAIMTRLMPDAMSTMLQSEQITTLPINMQRVLAVDIQSRNNSVVLAFARSQMHSGGTIFEYINNNDLSLPAKELLQAFKLGSRAVGDCECPLNSIGICGEIASRVPADSLPQPIQTDMAKKQESVGSRLLSQLRTFGENQRLSAYWCFDAKIATKAPGQQPSKHRKRQPVTSVNQAANFKDSIKASPKAVIVPPKKLGVTWRGVDAVRFVETSDTAGIDELIDEVLRAPMFEKYIRNHRQQVDLPGLIVAGLRAIFTAPNYREQRGLRHMTQKPPLRATVDGQRMVQWRLSGNELPSNVGGKLVRDTRIFFGVGSNSELRRVDLWKIAHKGDVKNRLVTGRDVI